MARAGYADWEEDDAFVGYDERPVRRVRRRSLPWLRLLFLSAISVAALAYFAQQRERREAPPEAGGVPASVLVTPAPVWKPVSPTPALYGLEKSLGPVAMEARQHTSGAREDTLVLGSFGDAPHARITLVQGLSDPLGSFFVDLVRWAARAGLSVTRNGMSRMVATKFGPVEVASVTLAGAAEQSCQAVRFSSLEAGFGFHGWLCGSAGNAMDDAQLACFIDGLTVTGAAGPSLKVLFAQADHTRSGACGPAAQTVSAGAKPTRRP